MDFRLFVDQVIAVTVLGGVTLATTSGPYGQTPLYIHGFGHRKKLKPMLHIQDIGVVKNVNSRIWGGI